MRGENYRPMVAKVCQHFWTATPEYGNNIMMDVSKHEQCLICGKRKIHAKIPEPHPSRSKEELLNILQRDSHKLIVEEWLPHNSHGP